jgi:membrane associated rhomboid family serine protease
MSGGSGMFPIGDDEVRGAGPGFLTITLVVINVLVFIYELSLSPSGLDNFFNRYGVVPALIVQGKQLDSLVTSMFLHGGFYHILGNMLFLGVFGDNIEAVLGEVLYLVFYFIGGFAASIAQILVNVNSTIPMVGASGAISAVLGAYILMFPQSRVKLLVFTGFGLHLTRIRAAGFLGFWAVSQLLNGFVSLGIKTVETGGVAFWAHIGGFVFGILIGFLYRGRARRLSFESW